MTDEIVLTLPRERRFYDVAHLVVGGLAVRLNLTVDNLADLQLAMISLLPRAETDTDITVSLQLSGDTLNGRIGPFEAEPLRRELEREGEDGYGTHHALETVFTSYRIDSDGPSAWVEFTMPIAPHERDG